MLAYRQLPAVGNSPMPAGMQAGAHRYVPVMIILIGVAVLLFARSLRDKGVLR